MKRSKSGRPSVPALPRSMRSVPPALFESARPLVATLSLLMALALLTPAHAQTPASAVAPDARTGLKAGLRDAGMAAGPPTHVPGPINIQLWSATTHAEVRIAAPQETPTLMSAL